MARSYPPSLFGREGETLGSLFRDVEKAFEDFSRRSPFAPPNCSSSMFPKTTSGVPTFTVYINFLIW